MDEMTMGSKVKNFFKANSYWFITLLAGLVYVTRGLVKVVETGKSVYEIVADSILAILFGFFIAKTMSMQGFLKGERDERVVSTRRRHGQIVEEITPYIDRLDDFCAQKTEETKREIQKKILAKAGLCLSDLDAFLQRGEIPPCEKRALRDKKRALKKASKLKITPLLTSSLTGDESDPGDPLALGATKKGFMAKSDSKRLFSKLATGLLFGYYGVQAITDFSWAQLIWTAIQTVMFLVMGVSSYMQSYFFMTDNYRNRIIRKMDYLQMFKNMISKERGEENEL